MVLMRGVILAGGKGTRLGDLTRVTNKHLLPVGPYPMVYHPIKKLVGAGVRDVLLVSGTEHMGDFVELLGSGRGPSCSPPSRAPDEARPPRLPAFSRRGPLPLLTPANTLSRHPRHELPPPPAAPPAHAFVMLKRVH